MLCALQNVLGKNEVSQTYEKLKHLYSLEEKIATMNIDLSIVNENPLTIENLATIRESIKKKKDCFFSLY